MEGLNEFFEFLNFSHNQMKLMIHPDLIKLKSNFKSKCKKLTFPSNKLDNRGWHPLFLRASWFLVQHPWTKANKYINKTSIWMKFHSYVTKRKNTAWVQIFIHLNLFFLCNRIPILGRNSSFPIKADTYTTFWVFSIHPKARHIISTLGSCKCKLSLCNVFIVVNVVSKRRCYLQKYKLNKSR